MPGRRRTRPARACSNASPRFPSPRTCAGSRSGCAARAVRSGTSPSVRTRGGLIEDDLVRGVHPMVGRRLDLWRLRDFRRDAARRPEDVLLYHCIAKDNDADQRLVAHDPGPRAGRRARRERPRDLAAAGRAGDCQLRRGHPARARAVRLARGRARHEPRLGAHLAADRGRPRSADRAAPGHRAADRRRRHRRGARAGPGSRRRAAFLPVAGRFYYRAGAGVEFSLGSPPTERLEPLDDYARKVVRARRRGTVYPYEIHAMVAGDGGAVVEHDLDDTGRLVPVDRPPGLNKAGIVVGVVTTPTPTYPDGMTRVLLSGDPTSSLGALSEAECARVIAALDLASDDARPGRVVRAVVRCPDLDGFRHREHGLGRSGVASASSSSRRPAARSTSWSPASTSARSRTGTPRPPCSCTPRASW